MRYQDIKPYEAPAHLEELRGPRSGRLVLPHWVYWGPNPNINLDMPYDVLKAYQAIIQEGRLEDQVELLNPELLVGIWSELMLPVRVRDLWVHRFPELTVKV